MDTSNISYLIELYAKHRNLSVARISFFVVGYGTFYSRIKAGGSCTIKTYNKVLQWFSDNWPIGLAWPAGVERPIPTTDSPAGQALVSKKNKAKQRYQLNAKNHIANPTLLCDDLTIEVETYRTAVKRYAHRERFPQAGSQSMTVVCALALVGDERFQVLRNSRTFNAQIQEPYLNRKLQPILEAA